MKGLSNALEIGDWRENKRTQRNIVREVVLQALEAPLQRDAIIDRYTCALNYHTLPELERNRIRVLMYDARTILGGWSRLESFEQEHFRTGELVPSTAAKRVRERSR